MAHRIPEIVAPRPPLHVLPRGTACVTDYAALMDERASVNRKIGWQWDGSLGPEFTDPRSGQKMRHGGRRKLVDQITTIAGDDAHYAEYVRHLKEGDLWAADPDTARAAGVPFEPHFLGEHPATSALHGSDPMDDPNVKALIAARAAMSEQERLQGLPWDVRFRPKGLPGVDKNPAPPAVPVAVKADAPAKPPAAAPARPADTSK